MPPRPTEVTLSLDDCEPNALPPVCVKCGAPAEAELKVDLVWFPKWIIFTLVCGCHLAYGILYYTLRKKRTFYAPLCGQHLGVWNWGYPIGELTAGAVVLLATPVLILSNNVGPESRYQFLVFLFALMTCTALFFGGIATVFALTRGITPKLVTDDDLVLQRVAPEFAEAVVAQQDADDAAYAAKRAARKPA